jgi:hypothetical protein
MDLIHLNQMKNKMNFNHSSKHLDQKKELKCHGKVMKIHLVQKYLNKMHLILKYHSIIKVLFHLLLIICNKLIMEKTMIKKN